MCFSISELMFLSRGRRVAARKEVSHVICQDLTSRAELNALTVLYGATNNPNSTLLVLLSRWPIQISRLPLLTGRTTIVEESATHYSIKIFGTKRATVSSSPSR